MRTERGTVSNGFAERTATVVPYHLCKPAAPALKVARDDRLARPETAVRASARTVPSKSYYATVAPKAPLPGTFARAVGPALLAPVKAHSKPPLDAQQPRRLCGQQWLAARGAARPEAGDSDGGFGRARLGAIALARDFSLAMPSKSSAKAARLFQNMLCELMEKMPDGRHIREEDAHSMLERLWNASPSCSRDGRKTVRNQSAGVWPPGRVSRPSQPFGAQEPPRTEPSDVNTVSGILAALDCLTAFARGQSQSGALSKHASMEVETVLTEAKDGLRGLVEQPQYPNNARAERGSASSGDGIKPVLTAAVVSLGVVSFWRGVWTLSDALVFAGHPVASGSVSLALGLSVLIAAQQFELALAPPLPELYPPSPRHDTRSHA